VYCVGYSVLRTTLVIVLEMMVSLVLILRSKWEKIVHEIVLISITDQSKPGAYYGEDVAERLPLRGDFWRSMVGFHRNGGVILLRREFLIRIGKPIGVFGVFLHFERCRCRYTAITHRSREICRQVLKFMVV
jgi:hypothetical protein